MTTEQIPAAMRAECCLLRAMGIIDGQSVDIFDGMLAF